MTYPYGRPHCRGLVWIARPAPVAVERYLVAYDVGKAVNPMLVEGQLVGGVVQGLGGALLEEFRYDARGEPLCVSLDSYLMPTAREVPPIDVLLIGGCSKPDKPTGT